MHPFSKTPASGLTISTPRFHQKGLAAKFPSSKPDGADTVLERQDLVSEQQSQMASSVEDKKMMRWWV